MIDIIEKGTEWVERWQEVTFSPTRLFGMSNFKLDANAFLFASGCLVAGYFSAIFSAAVYYAWYYAKNFASHMEPEKMKGTLEAMALASGVYVGVVIIGLLLTSAISFAVYLGFGSQRKFSDHFAAGLQFYNLEPLTALCLTIAFINYNNEHRALGDGVLWVFYTTRIYYFVLAFIALRSLHRLPGRRGYFAYAVGYIPPAVISVCLQVALIWFFSAVLLHILD